MNSSKRGAVYGFKLQSLDLVTHTHAHIHKPTHQHKNSPSLSQFNLWQPVINQLMLKKTDYWFVRIAFLCVQLLETKSTDRSQTLLHYIANMVRDKYPAVSPFYNELHYVDKAAAGESLSRESECLLLITGQSLDYLIFDLKQRFSGYLNPVTWSLDQILSKKKDNTKNSIKFI